MDDEEFNFDFGIDDDAEEAEETREEQDADCEAEPRRTVQMFKTMTAARKMRLLSEAALDECAEWNFRQGESYHFVSFGDVDSLSYLRLVARQQRIRYLCLATWCIAREDLEEIEAWVKAGTIGRVDFYVGEFTMRRGRGVALPLHQIAKATGGRVCRFFNHSKVMAIFGESFDCVIEGSANMNTNPRCENTCITVDTALALFYKRAYDTELGFDKGYADWQPWEPDGQAPADTAEPRTLTIMVGAQASGKSTYAESLAAQGAKVVSTDALRALVNGRAEVQARSGYVHEQAYRAIACHLQDGHDAVLDATNLNPTARRSLIRKIRWLLKDAVYIQAVEMDTPLATCLKRNRERERTVPEEKLRAAHKRWREARPTEAEGFDAVITVREVRDARADR